jgi:DNA-binding IclR family transcriptional regulator
MTSTAARKPVPAVQSVLDIFEYLGSVGNEPQTLSEICRSTSINLSTCFNILKTLESGRLISFNPLQKTYQLGFHLAELGAMVGGFGQQQKLALDEARRIAESVGLGCFVMTFTEGEQFIVLDKIESNEPIRLTIDVGAIFPSTGAVALKAWFAWAPPSNIAEFIKRHELRAYTKHSITGVKEFEEALALTRDRGYATSVSEYYLDHNAVAAPVFGWDGAPRLLLVVVGTTSQLSGDAMVRAGEEVAAAAARATKAIGGHTPRAHDE